MIAAFRAALLVTFALSLQSTSAQTVLSVPFRRTFSLSPKSSPLVLRLPVYNQAYSLSVAVCGAVLPLPQFFVSNDTGITLPGPAGGQGSEGGEELSLDEGLLTYSALTPNGGALAIWPSAGAGANWTFDVAVSDGAPLHQRMAELPLLGDTASTRALLFSPPFLAPNFTEPTFPNYTLQSAIPPDLSPPSSPPAPNNTLLLFPTANANQTVWLTNSACALSTKLGGVITNTVSRTVLRDSSGWRTQWFVDGLSPSTNYTAYVIEDGLRVSGPSFLLTKSDSFPCTLAHSLPYCPQVTYSIPLPAPPQGATSYTDANLPEAVSGTVIASLSNFTSSLKTFACGRDMYSPLQTCTKCQDAYRKWVCSVVFPRCGEPIPDESLQGSTSSSLSAQFVADPNQEPLPQAALFPRAANASARSPFLPALNASYSELLPCIETCNTVDRSCPPFLQWKCPVVNVNANQSYGIGFIDSWDGTREAGGRPGVAQDEFGRIWCNA